MGFKLTIPGPHLMRVGKETYKALPSGTVLHRIHQTAFQANQFNGTDRGNARFSPIRNPAGTIVPTIYGAESFECAACEIILRCPDVPPQVGTGPIPLQISYPADYAHHSHSEIRTTIDIELVDLTVAGQRMIGVNGNALLAGPRSTYGATRGWAEAIHLACPRSHGLYYSSYQYGPEFAVVLFGDRLPPDALTTISTRAVADAGCHDEVRKLAQTLSIEYEDV